MPLNGQIAFTVQPAVSKTGELTFEVAPGTGGTAAFSLYLADDGGVINAGRNRSAPVDFVIRVAIINTAPDFTLKRDVAVFVEDDGPLEVAEFASDVYKGGPGEEWQSLTFDVSFVSGNPFLFRTPPSLDDRGTLRFASAHDEYGEATLSISLRDDGGTQNGGIETAPGGPRTVILAVLPQPRVSLVRPAQGGRTGGVPITVTGRHFSAKAPGSEAECALGIEVRIGDQDCGEVMILSDTQLTCVPPPGIGANDVEVRVSEAGVTRAGVLTEGYAQSLIFYAGAGAGGSGGFVALGPAQWDVGTVSAPGASARVLEAAVFDKAVLAVTSLSGVPHVGGNFRRASGREARFVAKIEGSAASPVGLGMQGAVTTLSKSEVRGLVIAGGAFSSVPLPECSVTGSGEATVATGGFAAWDGVQWGPVGGGIQGVVTSTYVDGSTLYIAGKFNDAERRGNLAAYMLEGQWASFCDQGFDAASSEGCGVSGGEIYAMAVVSGTLYVGGSFQRAGFADARRVARWDGKRWSSMGTFNADIKALSSMGGRLFAAGLFTEVDDRPLSHIAVLENNEWTALDDGIGGPVSALLGVDACTYVCGSFTSAGGASVIGGIPVSSAARWCEGAGWEAVNWGGGNIGSCISMALA